MTVVSLGKEVTVPQQQNLLPSGIGQLQSLQVLQSLGQIGTPISSIDIAGMIGGGLIGWWIAKKYPTMIVKYIGVIVGAELGIMIARLVRPPVTT